MKAALTFLLISLSTVLFGFVERTGASLAVARYFAFLLLVLCLLLLFFNIAGQKGLT